MKKKIETEKIRCYNIFGIELFVNPAWKQLIKGKGIDNSFKVIHGEFFYHDSLEDCQIIVSEQYLNKFIVDYSLELNVVKEQIVYTKNSKATQKKLHSLELDVEYLFLTDEDGKLKIYDQHGEEDEGEDEYIFRLIER